MKKDAVDEEGQDEQGLAEVLSKLLSRESKVHRKDAGKIRIQEFPRHHAYLDWRKGLRIPIAASCADKKGAMKYVDLYLMKSKVNLPDLIDMVPFTMLSMDCKIYQGIMERCTGNSEDVTRIRKRIEKDGVKFSGVMALRIVDEDHQLNSSRVHHMWHGKLLALRCASDTDLAKFKMNFDECLYKLRDSEDRPTKVRQGQMVLRSIANLRDPMMVKARQDFQQVTL